MILPASNEPEEAVAVGLEEMVVAWQGLQDTPAGDLLAAFIADPTSPVPAGRVPEVLLRIAAAQSALAARLVVGPSSVAAPVAEEDRLLDAREAAALLRCSASHLYHNAGRYAFTVRDGHRLRFSSLGIQGFIRRRQGRAR